MAQNGMFRNAMGGFNKQDVLQYIDGVTAEWNVEREALNHQISESAAAVQQMQEQLKSLMQQVAEAEQRAQDAVQKAQVSDAQLAEVQQQLYDATADLAAAKSYNEQMQTSLDEAQARIAQLEQNAADLARQRDDAIAAVADAKAQVAIVPELEAKLKHKDEQMAGMQQAIARYEKVLGTAEEAEKRVDGIVRPLINQANKQADDTLDRVQAALAALLAQLGEVQGNVEQRRLALQRCKEDSDSRLTAAFGDLMEEPNRPSANHFFR